MKLNVLGSCCFIGLCRSLCASNICPWSFCISYHFPIFSHEILVSYSLGLQCTSRFLASNTKRERVVFLEGKTELWCGAPFLARREGEVTCALRARKAKFLPRTRESFPWMVFVQYQQMFASIFTSQCANLLYYYEVMFLLQDRLSEKISLWFLYCYIIEYWSPQSNSHF